MIGLAIRIYSIILPFIREILLGDKRIKKQERNINYFLIVIVIIMFGLLFTSNLTNGKLIGKVKLLEEKVGNLEEESRKLSSANLAMIVESKSNDLIIEECRRTIEYNDDLITELESIQCSDNPDSLSNKLRNLENGVCELDSINLKENMPPIPKISRTIDDDENGDTYTGEQMIKYIGELREYIRKEDLNIEKQKANCK